MSEGGKTDLVVGLFIVGVVAVAVYARWFA